MIKVERILCPTDLSTESDEALQYAVALARTYQAKLFLLHCSEQFFLLRKRTKRSYRQT